MFNRPESMTPPDFIPLRSETSVFHALEHLVTHGVRRLPVVDQWDNVTGICTQSMLVSIFCQNVNLLGDLANMKVNEFIDDLGNFISFNFFSFQLHSFA